MATRNPLPERWNNPPAASDTSPIADIAQKLHQMPHNKPLDPSQVKKMLAPLALNSNNPPEKIARDLADAFYRTSARKSLVEQITSNWWLAVPVILVGVALIIAVIAAIVMIFPRPNPSPIPPPTEISIKPSKIVFETKSTDLTADGKAQADVRVRVLDQHGNPVPDGATVQFSVDRADLGAVEPNETKTKGGNAQTTFFAKQIEGDVQVIATTGENVRDAITIHLSKPRQEQPILTIALSADPNHAVPAGSNITFTFAVKNNSATAAENVSLTTEIPQGTTFIGAQDDMKPNSENHVVWQLGTIRPGEERKRTLTVNISQSVNNAPIKLSNYALYDGNGLSIKTEGKIQFSIPVQQTQVSNVPASIEISSLKPNTLPADEKSTAQIIVLVRDSNGNPIKDPATVQFTLQPEDAGRIEPNPALTLDGQAAATFTSGNKPTSVKIVASTASKTAEVLLTLVAPARTATLKQVYHLITQPPWGDNKIIIRQMPVGTPLELIGEPQEGWQKVAVKVWVLKNMVIQVAQGQMAFAGDSKTKAILFGENPEDTSDRLNTTGARELYSSAPNYPVQIIDESNPTYFRIRVEGWTLADKLE